jgi:hypothetical protein
LIDNRSKSAPRSIHSSSVVAVMQQSTSMRPVQRSFFAKMWFSMRMSLRRLFGKKDDPNIYPFF